MSRIHKGIIEAEMVSDDAATKKVCAEHEGLEYFRSLCKRALGGDTGAWRVAATLIEEIDQERIRAMVCYDYCIERYFEMRYLD